MIVTVVGLVIVVLCSLYIAWPLLAGTLEEDPTPSAMTALEREKEAALEAIREIDFDHRVGKISDEDHRDLRANLEARALRALAALEPASPADQATPETEESPTRPVPSNESGGFCAVCGTPFPSEASYCTACGKDLSQPEGSLPSGAPSP